MPEIQAVLKLCVDEDEDRGKRGLPLKTEDHEGEEIGRLGPLPGFFDPKPSAGPDFLYPHRRRFLILFNDSGSTAP